MLSRISTNLRLVGILVALTTSIAAIADNTLTITARIVGSVLLTIESNGTQTSGSGSATITCKLGSLASMQTTPAGFTRTRVHGLPTLVSDIQAGAVKANMVNTSYALTARLLHPLPSGVTWRLNGVALSNTMAAIVATADFGITQGLSSEISVDSSASAATLDNAIIFTVVPK